MCRAILFLCATWALAFPFAAALRADEESPEKVQRPGRERLARVFERLDENGDGKVTADEVEGSGRAQLLQRLLRSADKDGDGALSREELLEGLSRGTQGGPGRAGRGAPRQGRRPNPKQFIKRFDKDGDGKVTREEVPDEARERFGRLFELGDKDGDGALNTRELAGAFRSIRLPRPGSPEAPESAPGRPGAPGLLFRLVDLDRDGKLSRNEINLLSRRFKLVDKDGDGALSREELAVAARKKVLEGAAPPADPKRAAKSAIKRLDKNGDSLISQDEAKGPIAKQFAKIDGNSDGQLDAEELAAGYSSMAKELAGGKKREGRKAGKREAKRGKGKKAKKEKKEKKERKKRKGKEREDGESGEAE